MPSLFNAPTYKEMKDNSGSQDAAIHNLQAKELERVMNELVKSNAELARYASNYAKGQKGSLKDMERALELNRSLSRSYMNLTSSTSRWMDRVADGKIREIFRQLELESKAYTAVVAAENDKRAREEIAKRQETDDRIARNYEEFLKRSGSIFDQLSDKFGQSEGRIDELIDGMYDTSKRYVSDYNSYRRNEDIVLFNKQKEELDALVEAYESSFEEIKDTMDGEVRQMYQESINQYKQQQRLFNTYYKNQMEGNMTLSGQLGQAIQDGMSEWKSGFNSLKDIFDSLNLHLITQTLTQGAESQIDVMSGVSVQRGMTYSGVKETWIEGEYNTYDGMIGASEIMKIYQMNNLTTDYLSDIASSMAMFEKETGLGNESLNQMLLWAQNSGIDRTRTVQVMDYLQSIRDDGADIESILAFENEQSALVSGHEEDFAAAMGALQAYGLDTTELQKIVSSGNTVFGTNDNELITLLTQSGKIQEAELAANRQDYTALASIIVESMSNVSDKIGDNNIAVGRMAGKFDMTANEIAMFNEDNKNHLTIEGFNSKMQELIESEGSIAENTESAGYVDEFTKNMNKIGTTWLGEKLVDIEEAIKDHPFASAFLGSLSSSVLTSVGKIGLKGAASKVKSKFGGSAAKAAAEAAGKGSAEAVGETVIKKGAEEVVEETVEEAAKKGAAKAGEEVAEEMAENMASKAATTAMGKAGEELGEEAGEGVLKALGKKIASTKVGGAVTKVLANQGVSSALSTVAYGLNMADAVVTPFILGNAVNEYENAKYLEENGNLQQQEVSTVGKSGVGSKGQQTGPTNVGEGGIEYTDIMDFWTRYHTENGYGTDLDSAQGPQVLSELWKHGFVNFIDNNNDGSIDDYAWITKAGRFDMDTMHIGEDGVYYYGPNGEPNYQKIEGTYKTGLSYVPHDNYLVELHKGERVLTAEENADYMGLSGGVNNNTTGTINNSLIDSAFSLDGLLDKLGNEEFQKIVKDGFEYIGKKLDEVKDSNSTTSYSSKSPKPTLTSMYLKNQWR